MPRMRKSIRTGQKQVQELIDSERRMLYVSINPVLDSNDAVIGAIMVTQDVTDQKKLQEQSRAAGEGAAYF